MIRRIKIALLPYIAPLLYFSKYLQLRRQINICFNNTYDVYCFFPAYHIGGAEQVHIQILQALHGYKIATFITYKSRSGSLKDAFKKNSTFFIDVNATGNYPFYQDKLAKHLAKNFNALKHPCTIFGCNAALFYLQLPLIKNSSIRVVDLLHAFAPYIEGIENISIRYVAFIHMRIVINEKTKKDYTLQYKKHAVDERLLTRIHMIYNALDTPCPMTEKPFIFPLRCLFVGRGSPEKRFHVFAAVAEECQKLGLPLIFTAVGNLEHYKAGTSSVQYRGEISSRQTLAEIYVAHHILITTSLYEGFPLTIMEAMCHGLINIATAVGGIPEHIRSGENGYLVTDDENEPNIVRDIVAIIMNILKLPEEGAKLSSNSIQYAQENFNLTVFREKYIEALVNH